MELKRDQNGDFEMAGTDAAREAQTPADEEMELSIFSDGRDFANSGIPNYSLRIKIGGTSFFGKELGAKQLEYVARETKAIATDSLSLKHKKQSEQQAAGEAVAARSLALSKWVIGQAISGWSNPRWTKPLPYNDENRDAMSNSATTRLSDDIVAKSYSGRAASDVAENF